jgi:hypothetical protein
VSAVPTHVREDEFQIYVEFKIVFQTYTAFFKKNKKYNLATIPYDEQGFFCKKKTLAHPFAGQEVL